MVVSRDGIARRMGSAVRGLLLCLLLLAPLPYGSVQPVAATAVQIGVALALILWALRIAAGGDPALPASRMGLAALFSFVLVGALQTLALPPGLLEALSPATARLYRHLVEAGGEALNGVSFPWTLSLSPIDTAEALRRFVSAAAVLILTASLFRGRARLAVLAGVLAVLGTFESAYGQLETLSGREQIFGFVKEHYRGSVTGTYINQNHFAGLIEVCLPVALALLLSRRATSEGSSGWRETVGRLSSRMAAVNLFLGLAVILMLLGLVLSRSRSGVVFGLFGVGVVLLGVSQRRRSTHVLLVTGLVGLTIMAFLVLGLLEGVGAEFFRLGDDLVSSGNRLTVWRDSIEVLREHPLTGTGLGSFAVVFPRFRSAEVRHFYDHAHNDLLEAFLETGFLGGILILIAFGAGGVETLRRLREDTGRSFVIRLGFAAGALALLLHSLTDFNLRIPANALLLAAAGGAALSPPRRDRSAADAAPVIPFPETRA